MEKDTVVADCAKFFVLSYSPCAPEKCPYKKACWAVGENLPKQFSLKEWEEFFRIQTLVTMGLWRQIMAFGIKTYYKIKGVWVRAFQYANTRRRFEEVITAASKLGEVECVKVDGEIMSPLTITLKNKYAVGEFERAIFKKEPCDKCRKYLQCNFKELDENCMAARIKKARGERR